MRLSVALAGAMLLTYVLGSAEVLIPATVHAAQGDCSQPTTTGANPTASDCLTILRAAVNLLDCTPECICAPKGTLPVTASDALLCLKKAVSQPVELDCPCATTTTAPTTTTTIAGGTTTTIGDGTTTTLDNPTTTVPPSSSTTTLTVTTTTTGITTTTLLNCDVRLSLASTEALGSLTFEVNYQLIFGLFVGDGDQVQCTELADADFSFSNDHANKILSIGMLSEAGLAGPVDLAQCIYATNDPELAPEDFRIRNVDAASPTSDPLDAEIEVSLVQCAQ